MSLVAVSVSRAAEPKRRILSGFSPALISAAASFAFSRDDRIILQFYMESLPMSIRGVVRWPIYPPSPPSTVSPPPTPR